jgi:ferredoxin
MKIRIEPAGYEFEAAPERTLLQAAEDAGIEIPSSCRNGTCRTCLRQLREGQVHYRIAWPGLSADEKREGYLLPCVAYAASDLVLAPQ